ncbi:uncharacterized protein M6B38_370835 [Iris pallida]|uniref:Uncharacterized protein n=1 Tax=Iris pallida TaxID=29817 RepID=A0AAX6GDK4_IRIPA|nr:uncharacterized protein M6B38_370835 [Iris pallida]
MKIVRRKHQQKCIHNQHRKTFNQNESERLRKILLYRVHFPRHDSLHLRLNSKKVLPWMRKGSQFTLSQSIDTAKIFSQ